MRQGRKHVTGLLAALSGLVAGGLLAVSPTFAEPDIADLRERVDELYSQAEVAAEEFNEARVNRDRARARVQAMRRDLARSRDRLEGAREQVVSTILAQSQGQALSSAAQATLAGNPDTFLQQLVMTSQYQSQQREAVTRFAVEARQLEMREQAVQRELERIARNTRALAERKSEIDERAGEAARLLRRLEQEAAALAMERAADVSRSQDDTSQDAAAPEPETVTPAPAASGRAAAAVAYAMDQVGDAYVYGASGPDAFDCSGLTMMAWAQAGVSLPHSSSMQMSSGTPVSSTSLQPGDLVFYYSPVSHVALYIGNGRIVHAANPSSGVLTAPVFSMPYSGAVRPG